MSDLIKNLRDLAAFAHGDVSFADEAADEIELLQAELNKAKTRGDILSDAIYYAIEVNDDCVNWLTDWFHGEPDAMRDLDRWREKTGRSKK